jgi:hypothetical protein
LHLRHRTPRLAQSEHLPPVEGRIAKAVQQDVQENLILTRCSAGVLLALPLVVLLGTLPQPEVATEAPLTDAGVSLTIEERLAILT